MVHNRPVHTIVPRTFPPYRDLFDLDTRLLHNNTMPVQTQEARIILVIETICTYKKMSIRYVMQTYDVLQSTFRDRIKGCIPKTEERNARYNLTPTEEDTIVQYILDLDSRGFPPRIDNMRDIADLLCKTRDAKPVGKQWPYNFVRRRPELKTRFSRAYDFQRVLCEDPKLINAWFRLMANIRTKYGIQDYDFYNFDETSFIMGVICGNIVIIYVDRRGRGKQLQPSNREWATTIEYMSSDSFVLPPFLILQGINHLAF